MWKLFICLMVWGFLRLSLFLLIFFYYLWFMEEFRQCRRTESKIDAKEIWRSNKYSVSDGSCIWRWNTRASHFHQPVLPFFSDRSRKSSFKLFICIHRVWMKWESIYIISVLILKLLINMFLISIFVQWKAINEHTTIVTCICQLSRCRTNACWKMKEYSCKFAPFINVNNRKNVEFSLNLKTILNDRIQQPFLIHYKVFNSIDTNFVHICQKTSLLQLINVDVQQNDFLLNSVHHKGRHKNLHSTVYSGKRENK